VIEAILSSSVQISRLVDLEGADNLVAEGLLEGLLKTSMMELTMPSQAVAEEVTKTCLCR
jgi:hypothetical protein